MNNLLTDHNQVPDDPMMALLGQADLSYHLLERSCITQSMAAVQWTLDRVYQHHGLGHPPEIRIIPDGMPDWMRNLSQEDRQGMLGRLPGALWLVARSPTVLPANAWKILDDAGLIYRDDSGKVVTYYYDPATGQTPYGRLQDKML